MRMVISRRTLLSALPVFAAARRLRAQEQRPTFSAGVKVVNLFATVRNKQGQIVKDLTQNDFLLDEDGRPQTIKYFSQESNLPLTLGLLVDTSGSQRRVLADERLASFRFLRQVLREDRDLAFVIHFDFEVELLQDLTDSRLKLEKALDQLEVASGRRQQNSGGYPGGGGGYPGSRGRGRGGYPGGGGGGMRGGGTILYDAVLLASDELMKKQTGRKALILLTDGVDTGSKVSLSHAVESAQRSDTLVYGVLFADTDAYGGGMVFGGRGRIPMGQGDGKKVLDKISRETGGRFFEVSKRQPIEKVFAAIEEDLRNQYSIGYTPDGTNTSGYRSVHLTAKHRGLIVQTREGYYPS
jgi:VWFA-related protein